MLSRSKAVSRSWSSSSSCSVPFARVSGVGSTKSATRTAALTRAVCPASGLRVRNHATSPSIAVGAVAASSSSDLTARGSATATATSATGKERQKVRKQIGPSSAIALSALSLAVGYTAGRLSFSEEQQSVNEDKTRVLPSGYPRSCCSCEAPSGSSNKNNNDSSDKTPTSEQSSSSSSSSSSSCVSLTKEQEALPNKLTKIVGTENVIAAQQIHSSNASYLRGARLGEGTALCIVTPTALQDAVRCVRAVVDADCVILPQGANTGLTGGSVPRREARRAENRDGATTTTRPVVVMNMRKLSTIFPIDDGRRVVCLAGAGINDLSNAVGTWFPDRESHSILGSVFLNPTTAGGVAFGSGGTQLRKGPAYTDRAMYVKVHKNKWDENIVEVVNTLGIEGIEDSDFVIPGAGSALEQLDIYQNDVREGYIRAMANSSKSPFGTAKASDVEYARRVCQCKETDKGGKDVSRYNADTRGLECNRSEGKVLILATVHDTFPKPSATRTFWLSFEDLDTALEFRREVCLDNPKDLPISVEYLDRDAFDVIDRSGRVLGNVIKIIGVGSPLVALFWKIKLSIEALPFNNAHLFCDKVLHGLNNIVPSILPRRFMDVGKTMDHHIAMTVGEFGDGTLERILDRMQQFASKHGRDKIVINECRRGSWEERSLTAFRFVAAPAFRTWCVGEGMQGISVDYALPKNRGEVPELAKPENGEGSKQKESNRKNAVTAVPVKRMRYSHFGCNVVHEDLAYGPEVDVHAAKMALKKSVEQQHGGRLPAEHGHGTEYVAPPETQQRWMKMDPLNVMNPGIGGLSSKYRYQK